MVPLPLPVVAATLLLALVADLARTPLVRLLAARRYVSPRVRKLTPEEVHVREVALALKQADPAAVVEAAQAMAVLLPHDRDVVLVPLPDHMGSTAANLALAQAIKERHEWPHSSSSAQVLDMLGRAVPVESSMARRIAGGRSLLPVEHVMTVTAPSWAVTAWGHEIAYAIGGHPVYLIDNVAVTGNSLAAAREALGDVGIGLVWARGADADHRLLLHGTDRPFKTFHYWQSVHLSDPVRSPDRKTQAEYVGEGPFGGWLATVRLMGKPKKFDPLNDPEAASVLCSTLGRQRGQERWWLVDYTDGLALLEPLRKGGWQFLEVHEPAVQGWSELFLDPGLLRVVRWYRWTGGRSAASGRWIETQADTWWERGVVRIRTTWDEEASLDWGGATVAGPRGTQTVRAWHVTDDPQSVLSAIQEDRLEEGGMREWHDLGPGLYLSAVPAYWVGRATGKWDFLQRLSPAEAAALARAVWRCLEERGPGYLTQSERDRALQQVEGVTAGQWPPSMLLSLADQPYNVSFWKPGFLSPLGIEPSAPPRVIEFHLRGRFAEMISAALPADLRQELRDAGLSGAFVRSGWGSDPQMVLWDEKAVVSVQDVPWQWYGTMRATPRSGRPKSRAGSGGGFPSCANSRGRAHPAAARTR